VLDNSNKKKQNSAITYTQILEKLKYYCAYQERCHKDVNDKLLDFQLSENERMNIISELIGENYLNEERFAIAFSEGKFRMKKWGRIKIKQKLKEKKVSDYCLKKGLEALEEDEYQKTLTHLVVKKIESIKESNLYRKKQKTVSYCYQKGYETELIWEVINSLEDA